MQRKTFEQFVKYFNVISAVVKVILPHWYRREYFSLAIEILETNSLNNYVSSFPSFYKI